MSVPAELPGISTQPQIGPVVFHLLQRPLLERLGVLIELDAEAAATEIAHHWLRAMRPETP
ncbi:MAG: hypothetical protein QOE72_1817 [Chloroflexota bacterium]|jgi:hypothetical protein|nr:hypothetical protein [Chloroflexota bacterium]